MALVTAPLGNGAPPEFPRNSPPSDKAAAAGGLSFFACDESPLIWPICGCKISVKIALQATANIPKLNPGSEWEEIMDNAQRCRQCAPLSPAGLSAPRRKLEMARPGRAVGASGGGVVHAEKRTAKGRAERRRRLMHADRRSNVRFAKVRLDVFQIRLSRYAPARRGVCCAVDGGLFCVMTD